MSAADPSTPTLPFQAGKNRFSHRPDPFKSAYGDQGNLLDSSNVDSVFGDAEQLVNKYGRGSTSQATFPESSETSYQSMLHGVDDSQELNASIARAAPPSFATNFHQAPS